MRKNVFVPDLQDLQDKQIDLSFKYNVARIVE